MFNKIPGLINQFFSPILYGKPTTSTPVVNDNSTQIANTSWVNNKLTAYAGLNSPSFTGNPTAPAPIIGDTSEKLANTIWVKTWVNSLQLATQAFVLENKRLVNFYWTSKSPNQSVLIPNESNGSVIYLTHNISNVITNDLFFLIATVTCQKVVSDNPSSRTDMGFSSSGGIMSSQETFGNITNGFDSLTNFGFCTTNNNSPITLNVYLNTGDNPANTRAFIGNFGVLHFR